LFLRLSNCASVGEKSLVTIFCIKNKCLLITFTPYKSVHIVTYVRLCSLFSFNLTKTSTQGSEWSSISPCRSNNNRKHKM
jgi:hypothetical protein